MGKLYQGGEVRGGPVLERDNLPHEAVMFRYIVGFLVIRVGSMGDILGFWLGMCVEM